MKIAKIEKGTFDVASKTLEQNYITNVNWPNEFPEKPEVSFVIAHDGDNVYIKYTVKEEFSQAVQLEDTGAVYRDSCVEFFVSFDGTAYYNFEFNCIGTALLAFRKERKDSRDATKEIFALIERYPSMERAVFEAKHIDEWSLAVTIPKEAFFDHSFSDLSGLKATANFYKCGDNLPTPHFVSWSPISNAKPNFHMPEFFGEVEFE
ncbi:MAG: carbohydrate-binding family 9-like protein [Rikenellaceae bacterium]